MLLSVRGFAEAAERLSPTDAVRRLNRFYDLATRAVIDRDGTVDKLVVEEVIAFFGTPYNEEQHERRAVDAALEVVRGLDSFLGEAMVGGVVGSGEAFVGHVGSGETRDYTAIGPAVTLAARLRGHAAPGEVLLLPETYEAVAAAYPDAPVRPVLLGDAAEAVRVHVLRAVPARSGIAPRERFLATILVLDLVGSTARAAELGDAAWRDLLARHYTCIREMLAAFRGVEVDTAGDGLLATFATPHQAIAFACATRRSVAELGLRARIGIHAGEVERDGRAIRGIAVVIASRISALGGADDVLVSATVRDLTAGSPWRFQDRGYHPLKGIPEPRQVFAALEGSPPLHV